MSTAFREAGGGLPKDHGVAGAHAQRLRDSRFARRYRLVFYLVTFLIIYGSLYPFDFEFSTSEMIALRGLDQFWRFFTSRGDILGNIGLFIPFGFFGMLALLPYRSRRSRLAFVLLLCFAISAGVQLLQFFLPSRDAQAGDVLWNLVGCVLGVLPVWPQAGRARALSLASTRLAIVPIGLLGCWLLSELMPLVPSLDLQSFKESVKPLAEMPDLLSLRFLAAIVSPAAGIFLASRAWPGRINAGWLLSGAAGLVFAKILIVQNTVSSTFALGLLIALLLTPVLLHGSIKTIRALAIALLLVIAIQALEPFNLRPTAQAFSWIPFSGALSGSMLINVEAILEKIFLFGSLLYALKYVGARPVAAAVLVAVLAFILEVAQIWVGDHTPVITDPLIALGLGIAIAGMREGPEADDEAESGPQVDDTRDLHQPQRDPGRAAHRRRRSQGGARDVAASSPLAWLRGIAIAGLAWVAATEGMNVVLGLPQIPYNVRDLFGGDDAWWRLALFALSGLAIGMGGAVAGRIGGVGKRIYLAMPGVVVATCTAIFFLLDASVTDDSIENIIGSPTTFKLAVKQHAWGDTAALLAQALGERTVDVLEHVVRFTALVGQLMLWVAILSAIYFRLSRARRRRSTPEQGGRLRSVAQCLIAAAPWLILFNLIAFTYASTDNLVELLDGQGPILYFLLILLPAVSLCVVRALQRPSFDSAVSVLVAWVVSLPVGWLLFKNGLGATVFKYGHVFSGVDFLLGPNRVDLLPELTLALRWCLVQTVVIVGLALGMQVVPFDRVAAVPARAGRASDAGST